MHHRHTASPSTPLHQESECHIPCPEKQDIAPMWAQEAEEQHTLKTTFKFVSILQFLPVLNPCPARFPCQAYPLVWILSPFLFPNSSTLSEPTHLKDASNGTKTLSKSLSTPNASHSPLGNYNSTGHLWSTPFHQLFQRRHWSFYYEPKEKKKAFASRPTVSAPVLKDPFWASHPFWQGVVAQLGAATTGRHLPRVVGAW